MRNDVDPNGDPLTASLVSAPAHAASFAIEPDGSFSYVPASDYHGPDSFTYEAGDGTAESDPATVDITIGAVNDDPGAREDSGTVDEDGFTDIPVLDNDSDVDGDALVVSTLTRPAHGTVTENADGTLRYAPNADFNGTDSFTYNANDGTEDSNAATVTVTVNPVNDAPTVSVLAGSGSQSACLSDAAGRITLDLRDVDDGAGALTLTAGSSNTRLVANRDVAFSVSGGARTATITTLSGRTGTSTVTLMVGDGQASGNVRVTVQAAGNGNDTLEGTGGPDLILGQNGDDTAYGREGSDVLCGANGDDRLSGGGGADSFDGGAGMDNATDFDAGQGDARKNIP